MNVNKMCLFGLILLMILSCDNRDNRQNEQTQLDIENLTENEIDSILLDYKFSYSNPIHIDSSDYILIPITTKILNKRKTYSRDGYKDFEYPRYWNIIFYNLMSNESNLLSNSKIRINDFEANHGKKYDFLERKVLYEISDIDFNEDNKLTGKDPLHLFISDMDGKNLQRISPKGENLESKTILNNGHIIIRTKGRKPNLR